MIAHLYPTLPGEPIPMQLADFTQLASTYTRYRSGYSTDVRDWIMGRLGKSPAECSAVDVGAGTGIWSRMLADTEIGEMTAVEPNDAMRAEGEAAGGEAPITWRAGSGEATGLEDHQFDLVTMASSFHWVDFERGAKEFHRILAPGGHFCALWNPRLLERSDLLMEVEGYLKELKPDMARNSSGASTKTERLMARFEDHPLFEDLQYHEGEHNVEQSTEQYLGAWRSVNDIQAQLGPDKFETFMQRVEDRVAGLESVTTTFWTRAWMVRVATR